MDLVTYALLKGKISDVEGEIAQVSGKVLSGTLTAGSTTLTLTDSAITTTSLIDVYTDTYGVNPTNVVATTGSITLTFGTQSSDVAVKVKVV